MRQWQDTSKARRLEVVPEARTEEALLREWVLATEDARRETLATRLLSDRRRAIYIWCRKQESDPETAEDLTQEILLRALTAMRRPETQIAHFGAWLFTLTRNHCANHHRTKSRRPRVTEGIDLDSIPAPWSDPGRELELEEERVRVHQWMQAHLSTVERTALWMRVVDELPLDQIARLLGLDSREQVRVLLQRARRHLLRGARHEMGSRPQDGGEMRA